MDSQDSSSTDDDAFTPDISNASSILLICFGLVAMLCTLFVAGSVHRFGVKSASSRLVFLLNCEQTVAIFSRLPFLFNQIPYGCPISGVLVVYVLIQMWVVCYMMLLCTNHLKLDLNSSISSELGLPKKYEMFIFFFPLLAVILPLSAGLFEEKYNWCGISIEKRFGHWFIVQLMVFMISSLLLMGHRIYIICKRANEYSHIVPRKKLMERIMKGPMIYAFVTIIMGLTGVLLVRATSGGNENEEKTYYLNYAVVYFFYIPGYLNLIIFLAERGHLKMFERHVDEVKEFEGLFDFDDLSDDGLEDVFSISEKSDSTPLSNYKKTNSNQLTRCLSEDGF